MLTQLLMARAALEHMDLDIDRHAELQCAVGSWKHHIAEASDWLALKLRSAVSRL